MPVPSNITTSAAALSYINSNPNLTVADLQQLALQRDAKVSGNVVAVGLYSDPPPINESSSGVNPDRFWTVYRRSFNGKEALYGGADYRISASG